MNKQLTPRLLIIGLVLTWAIWAIWPTVQYQQLTDAKIEDLRDQGKLEQLESRSIKQGLDLKGGMFIVLEVDLPTLVENLAINKDRNFSKAINDVRNQLITSPEGDFFEMFSDVTTNNNLKLSRYYYDYGSNSETIITALKEEGEDAINRVLEILQNRVDQFGVAEPTIQKQGNQRIIVELAGVQDSERARALLESTALLEFYLVKEVTTTNDLMIKIDQSLKGNEVVAEVSKSTEPSQEIAPIDEDETVSVTELFGETEKNNSDDITGSDVAENIVSDRPFSSLLRNLGRTIGVPEKNAYAVRKILETPEAKERLASAGGTFLFSHKTEAVSYTHLTLPTILLV